MVQETSFEAAAIAYLGDAIPQATDEPGIQVTVQDLQTGREHCFMVDLVNGRTQPCC